MQLQSLLVTIILAVRKSQVEDMAPETVVDPWHKLQAGFKGIRLLKNPTRLKEIRDSALQLKADYNEQIARLNGQIPNISDDLDELSAQHSIKGLEKRITAIGNNLAVITSRAKELVAE